MQHREQSAELARLKQRSKREKERLEKQLHNSKGKLKTVTAEKKRVVKEGKCLELDWDKAASDA